ncbi:hypothetical protein PHLCEN_2v7535 [Hermanssonia centrifuga]|uniref:Carboxypeptidase n=1 Tax=Hermanssonia centrifuga TaxID=98765 RepID=A0A2R6NWH1_9APHY|nr:hypothetical protein PHLCEN_2v7535 [Hermanssonia centrifuga]
MAKLRERCAYYWDERYPTFIHVEIRCCFIGGAWRAISCEPNRREAYYGINQRWCDEPLPGIDFDLGNNYAGNILVQRPNHRNDSLFFWGFEKEDGSLTAAAGERDTEPWAIWLQGGFVRFLKNLVKVFPSLANRPFYLTGESFAGRYIPYIVKALFSAPNPPVSLAKMVVGDPAFGSNAEFKTMPAASPWKYHTVACILISILSSYI